MPKSLNQVEDKQGPKNFIINYKTAIYEDIAALRVVGEDDKREAG